MAFVFKGVDFFLLSALIVQVSQPYRKIEMTRDLYSLYLVEKLMFLLLMILSSLASADVAAPILAFISFVDVPSFVIREPRYLKWVTSSKTSLFIVMSAGELFELFTKIFYFSVLTSIP